MEYNGERVKLTKGEDVKLVDPASALFDALKADGWLDSNPVAEPEKRRGRPPKEIVQSNEESE